MELFRTKTFKKDYQRIKLTDAQYTKYIKWLSLLLDGRALPGEARDHNLAAEYSGFREFHLGGDVLVVYCIEDDSVRLNEDWHAFPAIQIASGIGMPGLP